MLRYVFTLVLIWEWTFYWILTWIFYQVVQSILLSGSWHLFWSLHIIWRLIFLFSGDLYLNLIKPFVLLMVDFRKRHHLRCILIDLLRPCDSFSNQALLIPFSNRLLFLLIFDGPLVLFRLFGWRWYLWSSLVLFLLAFLWLRGIDGAAMEGEFHGSGRVFIFLLPHFVAVCLISNHLRNAFNLRQGQTFNESHTWDCLRQALFLTLLDFGDALEDELWHDCL